MSAHAVRLHRLRTTGARLDRGALLAGVVLSVEHDYLTQFSMFPLASFCRHHVNIASSMEMTSHMYLVRKSAEFPAFY